MKRNRGRSRRSGGQNPNRHYESTGPDVKIRGSAQQICEKYQQYARDALSAGDRVAAENYLQHAEHYFRIVAAMQPKDRPREDTSRDDDDDDGDEDENDIETAEADNASSDKRDGDDKASSRRSSRRSRARSGDSNTDTDDDTESEDSDDPMKVVADADGADQPQEIGKDEKASRSSSGDDGEKPKSRRRTYRKKSDSGDDSDDNSGVMAIVSRGASRKTEETEDTPAE